MKLHYYECSEETGKEICFDYDADDVEVRELYIEQFAKAFHISKEAANDIVDTYDLSDTLTEEYEDEIKDYFADEAWESYKEQKKYEADPLGYHGMSVHDFI